MIRAGALLAAMALLAGCHTSAPGGWHDTHTDTVDTPQDTQQDVHADTDTQLDTGAPLCNVIHHCGQWWDCGELEAAMVDAPACREAFRVFVACVWTGPGCSTEHAAFHSACVGIVPDP